MKIGDVTDLKIDRKHDALIIVDMQHDFLPGGALAVGGGDDLINPIHALLNRKLFDTVILTQDWHPPGHISFASTHNRRPFERTYIHDVAHTLWPDHCVQGTHGADLAINVNDPSIALILRKGMNPIADSYSAFYENVGPDHTRAPTGLTEFLKARGIETVYICGLAFDVCVRFTAEDAHADGIGAIVISDLCRGVDPLYALRHLPTIHSSSLE